MIETKLTSDFSFIDENAEVILDIQRTSRKLFLSNLKNIQNLQLAKNNTDNISFLLENSQEKVLEGGYTTINNELSCMIKQLFKSVLRMYAKFRKVHDIFIIELIKEREHRFDIIRNAKTKKIINQKTK